MSTGRRGRRAPADPPSPGAASETTDGATRDVAPANASAAASSPVPHDEIALRAYEKYAARDFTHGQDGNDWLQAEKELEAERIHEPRRSRVTKRG